MAALVTWGGFAWPASTPVTVVTETARRQVMPITSRGDAELLPIDQVIAGLGVSLLSDAAGGAATLTFQKREVGLYNKRSLASVQGDLRLLSAPVVFDGAACPWTPLRASSLLLDAKVEWRPAS